MSGLVPVNANAHSSVEIDDSCNDCCSCCWPRRIRQDTRRPSRNQNMSTVDLTNLKIKSASAPVLTQSATDEWEIMIDGKPITSEQVSLAASSLSLPALGSN